MINNTKKIGMNISKQLPKRLLLYSIQFLENKAESCPILEIYYKNVWFSDNLVDDTIIFDRKIKF